MMLPNPNARGPWLTISLLLAGLAAMAMHACGVLA